MVRLELPKWLRRMVENVSLWLFKQGCSLLIPSRGRALRTQAGAGVNSLSQEGELNSAGPE
jgi:hypothetical protein